MNPGKPLKKDAAIRLWNETVQLCAGVASDGEQAEEVMRLTPFGGFALSYGLKPWLSTYRSAHDSSHSDAAQLLRDWANVIDPPIEVEAKVPQDEFMQPGTLGSTFYYDISLEDGHGNIIQRDGHLMAEEEPK